MRNSAECTFTGQKQAVQEDCNFGATEKRLSDSWRLLPNYLSPFINKLPLQNTEKLILVCTHQYRGGGKPKILVWQALVNLSSIGMADCGIW